MDIEQLDLGKQADNAYEFEYENGVFISVIGAQSEKVRAWTRTQLNLMRQAEALKAKKGKDTPRTLEEDEEFAIEAAAIRITGWRGITQPFSYELAKKLCGINPVIRNLVLENSNEIANFTLTK